MTLIDLAIMEVTVLLDELINLWLCYLNMKNITGQREAQTCKNIANQVRQLEFSYQTYSQVV